MIIRSLKQHVLPLVGAIAAFTSCSPNRVPQPTPTSEPIHKTVKALAQESWAPSLVAGTPRYLIQDSSTISISGDSNQIVPFQSSVIYSVTFAPSGDSFVVVGRTDSLSANAHEHIGKRVLDTAGALEFHAIVSNTGKVSNLLGTSASICGEGINPVATRIFDLLISYPSKRLKVGDQWADTVSIRTCRGKTALSQKTIRQYQLLEFKKRSERSTAKILRLSSTVVTGGSIDSKNHLNTTGSGSGETTLCADWATGLLVQSDERSQTTLSISTIRGVYPFTQIISTHIEARP
jgi:hypothetical protein